MITALIIDDEAPAREELKRFLQNESDFMIAGEAKDGKEALEAIARLKPSVVFLDIHMPELDGLEVATKLIELESPPLVVFVTAYDQYAIKAFEVNAIDYVLKPFDRDRFAKTCQRIKDAVKDRSAAKEKLASLTDYLTANKPLKITGHKRNSKDRVFIHPAEVLYFHVQLTEVIAKMIFGEELLVNTTLKALMAAIDPNRFQQTHRAFIINLDQIEKVTPLFAGNYTIILKNQPSITVPLSRRYAQKLKKLLKW